MPLTLTEALQETKTLKERVEKKRNRLTSYLCRTAVMRDRLEEEGGEAEFLSRELQAIRDLETRFLNVKHAIMVANSQTLVTVEGVTRTIEDWLNWKREIAPARKTFLEAVLRHIESLRQRFETDRRSLVGKEGIDPRSFDLVVNLDEKATRQELEAIEAILGALDAKLSVKNATTTLFSEV